jgi:hypothetical protein
MAVRPPHYKLWKTTLLPRQASSSSPSKMLRTRRLLESSVNLEVIFPGCYRRDLGERHDLALATQMELVFQARSLASSNQSTALDLNVPLVSLRRARGIFEYLYLRTKLTLKWRITNRRDRQLHPPFIQLTQTLRPVSLWMFPYRVSDHGS